jgi:hypothetical protein
MPLTNDGRRTIGALIRDLADGSATLVRQEVYLARLEFTAIARAVGTGTGLIATGSVLVVLGALTLFIGIILLPGDQWLRDRYWLAALIVMLLSGLVAGFFAKRGMALLSPQRLAPDQTLATLKEDKEWLKQQLT